MKFSQGVYEKLGNSSSITPTNHSEPFEPLSRVIVPLAMISEKKSWRSRGTDEIWRLKRCFRSHPKPKICYGGEKMTRNLKICCFQKRRNCFFLQNKETKFPIWLSSLNFGDYNFSICSRVHNERMFTWSVFVFL